MPSTRGPWILAAAILGSSLAFIDGTVVNVALPAIQSGLGATLAEVQWIVAAYALTLAALLLTGGSLGDLYGRRRIFSLGVVVFTAASAWCGFSPNVTQLVAARALQGVGGALLVPGSLALITASFSDDDRGRAIGTWSAFTSITAALGPVLGGWLVQHLSWRWAFFINLPIAALVLVITLARVPESRGGDTDGPRHVDVSGAMLTTFGLAGLTFSLIEHVPWAGLAGIALLVVFVFVEAREHTPMLPLSLFKSATFSGANVLTLFLYTSLSGVLVFLPMNLISVQGYSATAAGAALLPFIALMFVLSRWAGGLVQRYGARRPLIIGPVIAAAGFALFARPSIGGSYWATFFPATVVLGLGMAVTVAPLTTAVMGAVPSERAGVASGVNNAVSRVAGLFGIAALGLVLSIAFNRSLDDRMTSANVSPQERSRIDAQRSLLAGARVDDPHGRAAVDAAFVDGFRLVVLIAAALAIASALATVVLIRDSPQRE